MRDDRKISGSSDITKQICNWPAVDDKYLGGVNPVLSKEDTT
ncbi:hypothetical protein DSUL_20237 [Desulfovibrionales bacterium]